MSDKLPEAFRILGDPSKRVEIPTLGWPIPPPNGTPPNDGCVPFDTVGRILDLEKQVAELRALLVGRE